MQQNWLNKLLYSENSDDSIQTFPQYNTIQLVRHYYEDQNYRKCLHYLATIQLTEFKVEIEMLRPICGLDMHTTFSHWVDYLRGTRRV